MAPTKVGLVGASGQTGGSILNGLLEDGSFSVVALVRPASMSKPANQALKDRGVELRSMDPREDSEQDMTAALPDIDILISAIGAFDQRDQLAQIPLATAAKKAGVKRFFPCAAVTVMPPGVHMIRDSKEQVYNHIKRIGLSYTIIDVGWWYQISFPPLPSGKIDYAVAIPSRFIPGDGNQPSALTDLRDIGRYVARIAKDERTVNKYVLVYNEMWSANQVYDLLEKVSGEKLERKYQSGEELENIIADAQARVAKDPSLQGDYGILLQIVGSQYLLSIGVRGDNTPEYAHYLGYVTSKDLYPNVNYVKYEDYMKEVMEGKAKPVYEDLKWVFEKTMKEAGA